MVPCNSVGRTGHDRRKIHGERKTSSHQRKAREQKLDGQRRKALPRNGNLLHRYSPARRKKKLIKACHGFWLMKELPGNGELFLFIRKLSNRAIAAKAHEDARE